MNERLAVYALDVGQGDCTLILLPDKRAVVFHCADDHVLRRVLDDCKVTIVEAFIVSHLDQDHIAGALAFLRGFERAIRHVYLSPDRDVTDEHGDAKRAKELVDHAAVLSRDDADRPRRWERHPNVTDEHGDAKRAKELVDHAAVLSRDDADRPRRWERHPNVRDHRPVAKGQGWRIALLAPDQATIVARERTGSWEEPNRYCSILRVEAGGNALLIGGDAPLATWSTLPAAEMPAVAFRIPHHGGALDDGGVPSGWDAARLYGTVGAKTAVVPVGTRNGHGHPDPQWLRPVSGSACRLLCTQVTLRCHDHLARASAYEIA